tara:strand:+ start:43 stop:423 length:381 start_codon:yes stop_codon:yes gene_type:complete
MLNDPEFLIVWREFKEMRKAKKKPLTKNAENRQLSKVNNLYNLLNKDITKVVQHMELVCNSCWENIYRDNEHLDKIINSFTPKTNDPDNSKSKFTFGKESEYNTVANHLQEIMCRYDFVNEVTNGL